MPGMWNEVVSQEEKGFFDTGFIGPWLPGNHKQQLKVSFANKGLINRNLQPEYVHHAIINYPLWYITNEMVVTHGDV